MVEINGETSFEHISGADYCIAFCAEYWSKKLINEMIEQHPDEVVVEKINPEDNSILARIPFKCMKYVRWPTKKDLTDEQRQALSERGTKNLEKFREEKKAQKALEPKKEIDETVPVVKKRRGRPPKHKVEENN